METIEENLKTNGQMVINDEIKNSLTRISKWTKFLAILGFICIGLIIIAQILVLIGSYYSNFDGAGMALIYVVIGVVYYFPLNYLIKSANSFKKAVNSDNQEILNSGFTNLSSHFKFMGILTIIVAFLYILIFFILILMKFYRF